MKLPITESEWIGLVEKVQAAAQREGKISPLDILILLGKGDGRSMGSTGWRISIYNAIQNFRKRIIQVISKELRKSERVVLFFATEPTHVTQMIPVARALSLNGGRYLFVTPRVPIFNMLRSRSYEVVLATEASEGSNLLTDIGQVNDLLLDLGLMQVISIVKRYYDPLDRLAQAFVETLSRFSPSYVVIGNDLTWECRLLGRVCELQSTRTGMIQHGLLGHEIYNKCHIVNDIFVYGTAFKAILESDGLRNANIVVTGAPYLDSKSFGMGMEPNLLIKRRFGLKGTYILIAFSGAGDRTTKENYFTILSWIRRLIDEHKDLDFVIKLHRKERLSAYSEFSRRHHARILDRRRAKGLPTDIFEWFRGCDCLITGTSTLAYEAMLFNIPIISLDPLRQYSGINFIEEKVVPVVTTYRDLEEILLRELGKRVGYSSFIDKIFAHTDGQAATRIWDEIKRVKA